MTTDRKRNLPHSYDAERASLGAILFDNGVWSDVSELVSAGDYYVEAHRDVFAAMAECVRASEPIDRITVSDRLRGKVDPDVIMSLDDEVATSQHAREHAKIVHDRARLRELIARSNAIAEQAQAPNASDDVNGVVDRAQASILGMGEDKSRAGPEHIQTVLVRSFKKLQELSETGRRITGVATGWHRLDHVTCGLQRGDLVVVAGRPSMGKSALSLGMAMHAASIKVTSAVYTLEMSSEQNSHRVLSVQSGVDGQKIRTGELSQQDWLELSMAAASTSQWPLFFDERAGLTPMDIAASCRRIKRDKGLGLVVVDQLSHVRPMSNAQRSQQFGEICKFLKVMAKQIDVPVVLVSQLNRGLENRTNRRPMMSDLRDSGEIEQDADMILFVHREDYYRTGGETHDGIAEVIIAKQRMGPAATVKLKWNGPCTRFENLDDDDAKDQLPLVTASNQRKTNPARGGQFTPEPPDDDVPFSEGDGR
jgi:replicative DNA helicase